MMPTRGRSQIPPRPQLPHPRDVVADLSRRQLRILELVGEGRSNREISQVLSRTEATIKTHVCEIMRRLGTDRRAVLVLIAVSVGLHRPVVTKPPRRRA